MVTEKQQGESNKTDEGCVVYMEIKTEKQPAEFI